MPEAHGYAGVAPIGTGTPFVESLSGYLQRLANIYEIPPATLFQQAILPVLREHGLWKAHLGDLLNRHSYAMNGTGEAARLTVDRLSHLTGRQDLSECSLMTVGELGLVHQRELVATGKRWCCACWRADGGPGARYERKLWGLSVVEACPVHGTVLIQRCFACGRRQPAIVRDVYVGVCGRCGVDLCAAGTRSTPREEPDAERQSWYAREAVSLLDAVNVSQLLGFDADGLDRARRRGLETLLERSDSVRGHPAAGQRVRRWQRRWGRPSLEEVFSVLWRARWPVVKLFPDDVQRVVTAPLESAGRKRLIDEGIDEARILRQPDVKLRESPAAPRTPDPQALQRGVALFLDLVRRANRGEAAGISYVGFIEHVYARNFVELSGRPWSQGDVPEALSLADQVTAAAGGRRQVTRGSTAIAAAMDTFIWRAAPPHERPSAAWDDGLPYSREDWLAVFPETSRRLLSGDR